MSTETSFYNKYLLFIAGLGGLLYGIDVGVIAGALPYLQATTGYSAGQLSTVVAAVLLGSVLSSLFAGALSDLFGRKKIMILAGICFVLSVPVICLPGSFEFLVLGRILQGAAAGLIGVVVPLYLAECLTADKRGSGTGMFQFMLTVGLVFAALVGVYFSMHVEGIIEAGGEDITVAKEFAWKAIFWVCAAPGAIFTIGALFISESPRWLFTKNRKDAALKALERSRGKEAAKVEFEEMGAVSEEKSAEKDEENKPKDSLFKKKYIIPFVIAVVILACNQATGINSVLAYIVNILNQAGLDGSTANKGDLFIKILNCLMTVAAMILVDRKGRKFLLTLGTSGIIVGLLGVAALFTISEKEMQEKSSAPIALANAIPAEKADANFEAEFLKYSNGITLKDIYVKEEIDKEADKKKDEFVESLDANLALSTILTPAKVQELMTGTPSDISITDASFKPQQIKIVYKYGELSGMKTMVVRPFKDDEQQLSATASAEEKIKAEKKRARRLKEYLKELRIDVSQKGLYTDNKDSIIGEFFRKIHLNPFPDPAAVKDGGFVIEKLEVGPVPSEGNGWLVTLCFAVFIAAYAVGPGVCVWLALSELMPTRIRSNGMSIALLINQFVSTVIAGTFLPVVGNYGYSTIFFFCAGCTVIYWITAVFFLPETKGRTLEEIEAHFDGTKKLK